MTVRQRPRRTVEERFAIRFRRVATLLSRLVLLLPPRSRLRRAALSHGIRLGVEAYNRGDYEAVLAGYDPDVELVIEPELVELGFDATYRGHDGWRRYHERWMAEWGAYESRPEELWDLGNGLALAVGAQRGRGAGSGAEITRDLAFLWTFSRGLVTREQYFFDRGEAFGAAGLDQSESWVAQGTQRSMRP